MPELHTLLDKPQHGMHEYDVLKHSLKVMQKVVQNPEYEKLNTSKQMLVLAVEKVSKILNQDIFSVAKDNVIEITYQI